MPHQEQHIQEAILSLADCIMRYAQIYQQNLEVQAWNPTAHCTLKVTLI